MPDKNRFVSDENRFMPDKNQFFRIIEEYHINYTKLKIVSRERAERLKGVAKGFRILLKFQVLKLYSRYSHYYSRSRLETKFQACSKCHCLGLKHSRTLAFWPQRHLLRSTASAWRHTFLKNSSLEKLLFLCISDR